MIFDRLKLVKQEASKVTWPSYREAVVSSAIVMSLMGIAGVGLWIIDYCLGAMGGFLLKL
jgi:preprotein translocase SecE subunit